MNQNENYKSDAKRNVYLNRRLLLFLGIWPFADKKNGSNHRISQVVLIVLHIVLLLYVLVPGLLYIFLIEKEVKNKLKLFPFFFYGMMTLGKYSNLIYHVDEIGYCLRHLEEDWRCAINARLRDTMNRYARIAKRLLVASGVLMYGSGSTYRVVLPLTRERMVNEQNVTIRPLSCQAYFIFFDTVDSPAYEIIYFFQLLSAFVTFSITTAGCGLAALFVMHACGQLEILKSLMKDIVDEDKFVDRNANERLVLSIEQQTRIRDFLQAVEDCLQQTFLIEVISSTILLCIVGFFITTEWSNQNSYSAGVYLFTFTSMTCNIFLFCYIGEQFNLQAEKVATTSCILEWYRLPNETARSMILMIAMANFRTKITAGNMIDLSLRTFSNVMKTALTYCNMLRTVT